MNINVCIAKPVKACPINLITFEKNTPIINRQSCNYCGICQDACPTEALTLVGKEVTVEELMKEIEKDTLYYDNSGGGVTFSEEIHCFSTNS